MVKTILLMWLAMFGLLMSILGIILGLMYVASSCPPIVSVIVILAVASGLVTVIAVLMD